MQKLVLAVLCSIALMSATVVPALAVVNCGLVNKDLKLGRKPEDIAERMGITVGDVNECKEKGSGTTAGTAAPPKSDTAPKGAAAPAGGSPGK